MQLPSFTLVVSAVFVAYIAHSLWSLYSIFIPVPCPATGAKCIKSYLQRNPELTIWIYSHKSTTKPSDAIKYGRLLGKFDNMDLSHELEQTINCSIPLPTRKNGTLFAHVFLTLKTDNESGPTDWLQHSSSSLTTYAVPQAATFSLVGSEKTEESKHSQDTTPGAASVASNQKPISHLHSQLVVSVMTDDIAFDVTAIPGELHPLFYLVHDETSEYYPLLYIDEFSSRTKDLLPINLTSTVLPLTLRYRPISFGKLRLWINMKESLNVLQGLGFTEKDTDEVKGLFVDTSLYLLLLTFLIAAFHLLFDFLAFKNDINYWRERKTMIGLSSRSVVWRCVSTIIIFLYLLDEQTSMLVLIPAGIGSIIEVWKVVRAFRIRIEWNGWTPSMTFGDTDDQEKETADLDSQAMKYLSYLLYPLVFCGAIYSLMYTPHKSWYSWCVQSLVNGVYAFGFIFMCPQLFINYKLKSVAHLPWRAFMYKAFNTFIDDVFAFIITMPTAHRLACFRDDIIFVIYLYQRWLYPVDKTRVNEFGQSFDEQNSGPKEKEE